MLKKKEEDEKREEQQWRRADFLRSVEFDKLVTASRLNEDKEARRNTIQGLNEMKTNMTKSVDRRYIQYPYIMS